MKIVLGIAALLASAGMANAQFVASNAGPLNSDGPVGTVTNGSFGATYGGAGTIFGSIDFVGDLTSGEVGSYLSEARWNVKNLNSGVAAGVQFASGTTWTGTVNVAASRSLFMWANSGDNFSFEAYESYNDPGVDATWTNVSFTFNNAAITNIGSYAPGDFDLNTFGSGFDTEIALYSGTGTMLGTNDDSVGLESQLLATLGEGDYYVLIGGYNSTFVNGAASGGSATGHALLNFGGTNVGAGDVTAGSLAAFSFHVIPAPGSVALMGLAGLIVGRRRR